MYLYAKGLCEAKSQFLIKKRGGAGIKHWNDYKAFIKCSNNMDGIYENIVKYNLGKEKNIYIVVYDMIAAMLRKKNLIE